MRRLVLAFAILVAALAGSTTLGAAAPLASIAAHELPPEARETLALIKRGGPFPYRRDGIVFGNFEHRLPRQAPGYYHEYTVPTAGTGTRGARRLIAGSGRNGDVRTSREYYYTDDHYRSFRQVAE